MSWALVKLGDICDLFNGYAFKSSDYVDTSNTLSCRMSNIRPGGRFDIDYNSRFLPDSFSEKFKQFKLNDNDVVIAMTDLADSPKILGVPTVIKTNGKNIMLNQRVGKLIIKKPNQVHFPYLQLTLNSPSVRSVYKKFAGGGLQINLGKKDLLSVEIPLPPLAKQQQIAAILDAADSLRQKDQQLIDHYTALSQSLFLDMFGDPASNPMGWESNDIGNHIVKVQTWNPQKTKIEESFTYIDLSSVNKDKKTIELPDVSKITSADAPSRARQLVKTNDVLVSTVRPNLNGVAIVPDNLNGATASTGYCVLRSNTTTLNQKYLLYWVQSDFFINDMVMKSTGANYPAVSDKVIKENKINLPTVTLQNQFAERITIIEQQKQQAQSSLEKSEALFNSLLQRAFSGELTGKKGA